MAREVFKVEGLKDVDQALNDLIESTSKATGKAAVRRSLVQSAQPVAEHARRLVRVKTGRLRDSIVVSAKLANPIGNREFREAMQAGLGRSAAVEALRGARRAQLGSSGAVVVHVGAGQLPHAHLVEFGTFRSQAYPYMRPAWEAEKMGVLHGVTISLGEHIQRAAERAAKRFRARPGKHDTRPSKG